MRLLFAAILFLINLFSGAYGQQRDLLGTSENEQLIRNNLNTEFVKNELFCKNETTLSNYYG